MGRRTFESIGRVLPERISIVLSHDTYKTIQGVLFASSLEEAIKMAKDVASDINRDEVFIIGGGQIFKEALEGNLVDRMYLTKVKGDYHADTFFPEYAHLGFKAIEEEHKESDGYRYSFVLLEK